MPEQQDSKGWEEALRRIEEAKQTGAVELDLSDLGLTAIEEEATQDGEYLRDLLKDLKLMERNALISTWYDRGLTAGEKREPRILQELNEADVIVCQLSRDFLNSDFCVLTELDTAIKRQEAGKAVLVAYVLTHCGWKEVPKLSAFQILPSEAKPLVDWNDKNKYWRAVAEGIQAAIKKLQKERRERPSSLEFVKAAYFSSLGE